MKMVLIPRISSPVITTEVVWEMQMYGCNVFRGGEIGFLLLKGVLPKCHC